MCCYKAWNDCSSCYHGNIDLSCLAWCMHFHILCAASNSSYAFVHVVEKELRKKGRIDWCLHRAWQRKTSNPAAILGSISIHIFSLNPACCFAGSSCISAAHRGVRGVLAFSFRSPRNVAAGTQQCRPTETGQHNTYSLHCVLFCFKAKLVINHQQSIKRFFSITPYSFVGIFSWWGFTEDRDAQQCD